VKVGLISDTHGRLRASVFEAFADVDLILHAGDVGPPAIIVELEAIAPVQAVLGNTDTFDLRPYAADALEIELEGKIIVVLHGHQLGSPSAESLHEAYPDADVIVYGHTHRQRVDTIGTQLIINPGAAGPARFNLEPCVALLTVKRGEPAHVEHILLK
jgi:uncharacterized protein